MLALQAGDLACDVAPEAGMVVASLRHRGAELLAVRQGLDAYRASGATFGVPLLYPFANRLSAVISERIDATAARRDERGLPLHGLPAARGAWEVVDRAPDRVRAALAWDDAAFRPPHRVEVTHALDAGGLTVTTRVEGDGVPVAFGWHPYVAIERESTELSIPVRRRLVLDERGIPTGDVEDAEPLVGPLKTRTFDDLFEAPADGEPFRAGGVSVAFEAGAPYAQVFSPPGAAFVAFEPMTAPTNALVTGAGLQRSPFEQRFRIEVS